MNDGDAGIFGCVFIGDATRRISGAVVDEDDLEIFISLLFDGIEAGGEVLGGVVDGYDDGDFGVIWHWWKAPWWWILILEFLMWFDFRAFCRRRSGRRKGNSKP